MKRARTEHDAYHERMLFLNCILLVVDLVAAYWAAYYYENWSAILIFLVPALPVACVAISHWISGLLPASKCICNRNRPVV